MKARIMKQMRVFIKESETLKQIQNLSATLTRCLLPYYYNFFHMTKKML